MIWAAPRKKAVSGFAGVPFAFQKKQTIRFAPALSILAAKTLIIKSITTS
jgi:hypothetical protein